MASAAPRGDEDEGALSQQSVADDFFDAWPPLPVRRSNHDRKEVALEKLIITAGLTGSRISREMTPRIPIAPDETARAGVDAGKAGASVLHVHVRGPETGVGSHRTWSSCGWSRTACAPRPTRSSA